MNGHVDLRSFDYAMEPLRRRRSWELDIALARQANASAELFALEERVRELDRDCDARARDASAAWHQRPDATGLERNLKYLAALQGMRAALLQEVDVLQERLAQLKQQSVLAQQRLEVLNRHRQQESQEYAGAQLRAAAAEADRDWMARRQATQRSTTMGDADGH
ncbi:MAG TPA: hypothetical protein VLJ58_16045 [Ramlibacter sp.]|nr:hypothetical protein [Ramlibacter sp.]